MKRIIFNVALVFFFLFICWMIYGKVFGTVTSSIISKETYNQEFSEVDKTIRQPDTFKLSIINRNPFKASKAPQVNSRIKQKQSVTRKVNAKPDKPLVWPSIKYYGFVQSERSASRLVVLNVNGKLYRKRINETIDGLKIIKAHNDSIIVAMNGTTKTIIK